MLFVCGLRLSVSFDSLLVETIPDEMHSIKLPKTNEGIFSLLRLSLLHGI
jgi:hypothetical protein